MVTSPSSIVLNSKQFAKISGIVYEMAGINLKPGKEELVKTRLVRRLTQLGMSSFDQYIEHVCKDRSRRELIFMLDSLTTNKTSFFRETDHFDFLRSTIFPGISRQRKIRIWSAGCSTGEEPTTIALEACQHFPDLERRDFRILATDLSTRVLDQAKKGIFSQETIAPIPPALLQRHFERLPEEPGQLSQQWQLNRKTLDLITFARLNLMGEWPMQGPFDAIFCRNVMIYFDKATQERLVNRYGELLSPGGFLLIGHSESLTGLSHPYRFVQPAVYQKAEQPVNGKEI